MVLRLDSTTDDIVEWMEEHGYAQYVASVVTAEVQGEELQALTSIVCKEELGFPTLGLAIRFVYEIHEALYGRESLPNAAAVAEVKDLPSQDVVAWLQENGLANWVQTFSEEAIGVRELFLISNQELTALGLRKLKDQHIFFAAMSAWRKQVLPDASIVVKDEFVDKGELLVNDNVPLPRTPSPKPSELKEECLSPWNKKKGKQQQVVPNPLH